MPILSTQIQKFIEQAIKWREGLEPKTGTIMIHVDEIVSRVVTFYEKIRSIISWRDQHLIRRATIERILKRRLFLKKNIKGLAEQLILELIHSGRFPNDKIPRAKIQIVQKIIDKYFYILNNCPSLPKEKTKGQLFMYILDIAACEIEEALDPAPYLQNDILIELMGIVMKERIVLGKRTLANRFISETEKETQIYIAIQQALLKLDKPIILYNLLKRRYPNWINISFPDLEEITRAIHTILDDFEKSFSHPLADKFYRICERYDTLFLILGDIVFENPAKALEILAQQKTLEEAIKKSYNQRLHTLKSRINRMAFYSTLSIFLVNIFSLYILEIPFTKFVMGRLYPIAQIVDVLGPTLLMFIIVKTTKPPKQENLCLVKGEIKKIVHQGESPTFYEIEIYPKPNWFLRIINNFLYFITFCLSFGLIIYCLYRLKFPPFSYVLLILFTSLIAFTGTIIRGRAKELDITETKDSVFNLIFDPFALPISYLGKWLAARWEKINILNVAFDYLIDNPFLVFVEFIKSWRYFLKEKKDGLR